MSFLKSVAAPILFPSILWHAESSAVHITFDDGPHPAATPKVLDILEKRNILATFFLVGANAQRYPDLASEIVRRGHSVGNHSMTHRSLIFRPIGIQQEEILLANEALKGILGFRPGFFRPPYGYFDSRTLRLARAEGQKVVMWDIDSRDFTARRPEQVSSTVSGRARGGSIILFHDNEYTAGTVGLYLASLLDRISDRGLQFSSLTI